MNNLKTKWLRKLREWFLRYLPAEIGGTIFALAAAWWAHHATGSLVVAAIAGTIGENIGYYGVAASRDAARYWRVHATHAHARRIWLSGLHTVRGMLVEFGAAEVIDTFLVRPTLFYVMPTMLGGTLLGGIFVAKLAADAVFYMLAIIGYEIRKHKLDKELVANDEPAAQ